MFIKVGLINTQAASVCFLKKKKVQIIMYQDFNRGLNKTIFKLKCVCIYIYLHKRIIMCKKNCETLNFLLDTEEFKHMHGVLSIIIDLSIWLIHQLLFGVSVV